MARLCFVTFGHFFLQNDAKLTPLRSLRKTRAFSLVEIVVALGILSVAVIPLFGLLPVGMNIFKDAIDTTVQSQIMEKLTTLAEQTEFSKIAYPDNPKGIAAKTTSVADKANVTPVYYYYDDQGSEIPETQKANSIYTAAVTYLEQTGIPNGSAAGVATKSDNIITLWVDIYNNKGIFKSGKPVDLRSRTFMLHIANYGRRI